MEYSIKHILIKDNWFESNDNKFQRIGLDGFYLYLTLFRFYISGQEKEFGKYTFFTTIASIKKETGYTYKKIDELIKLLFRYGVIKSNITRWTDQMYVDDEIKIDKGIIFYATDDPITKRTNKIDVPVNEDNYYTSIDLELMQFYIDQGLNEKYCALYCLLKKLSKGDQRKSWMSIGHMSEVLKMSSKTIHNMIRTLNEHLLLATYLKESVNNKIRMVNGEKVKGHSSEHYLLFKLSEQKEFLKTHGSQIQKNIVEWSKEK